MIVWTFRDEHGKHHPAVAVARTEVGKRSFALAVSDRPGLIVLEEKGETAHPVRDPKIVARVEEALRSTIADAAEPALIFEAKGPGGRKLRYAATRAVAHAGELYLVAVDPSSGAPVVFRATEKLSVVTDEAMLKRVREIASEGERAPAAIVLTLPSGERRDLDIVRQARIGNANYAIGVDRLDATRVFALRIGANGALHPVTDPSEVERVRIGLTVQR
jgi:hypothetical protein